MKNSVQYILELFNTLNDEDKLIICDKIYDLTIKLRTSTENKDIDCDKIYELSWF
jgi:hypothetical protein